MAPSAGHLHKLVVKNIKLAKHLWNHLQTRLPAALRPTSQLQLIPVRVTARQPIHPAALLRQSKGKWYTTHSAINAAVRRFTTAADASTPGLKYNRSLFPKSRTASAVNSLPGRAPFASALRPNLTGGAFRRTAGGYSLGSGRAGGARYFSHTPAAPAQVLQNVSQAVRAFCVSGQKAQFSGVDARTGEKRFRAVSSLQDKTLRKVVSLPKATPGSYIDFSVNPTITALTPLSAVAGYAFSVEKTESRSEPTLNSSGLLDILSTDFSRSLKDLAAILNDLKRLAALGDLPITYRSSTSLRVHFPGCDAESVEKLCDEIGVQRGVVVQDEGFDSFVGTEIALLFPFAPSRTASEAEDALHHSRLSAPEAYIQKFAEPIDWRHMLTPSHSQQSDDQTSMRSEDSVLEAYEHVLASNPWASGLSSPEGYESLSPRSDNGSSRVSSAVEDAEMAASPLEYHDFEGIRRFIELCDGARR